MAAWSSTRIGWLKDRDIALSWAMALCFVVSGIVTLVMLWLGPAAREKLLEGDLGQKRKGPVSCCQKVSMLTKTLQGDLCLES